jgi:hypothetical protein
MNGERTIQRKTHIHIFKSLHQRRNSQALIANSELQMKGIPKFAVSYFTDSIVDMDAPIYFPEESTTTLQNYSDTWLHIDPFTSPAIYERKKSNND